MVELTSLSRPYAEAVFCLAEEQGRLKQWSDTLQLLAAIAGERSVIKLAGNPKVSRDLLLALFLDIGRGVLDKFGTNFIKLVLENNRLQLLPVIAAVFESLKAEAENSVDVEVVSAFKLNRKQLANLSQRLKKRLGHRKINLTTRTDSALIGGMIVRAGDLVIDGSVTGHLDNLAAHL